MFDRGCVLKSENFRSFPWAATVFPMQDVRDLGSQNRHRVHDDIPPDVIIHTEATLYQAIFHLDRCQPIDVGIRCVTQVGAGYLSPKR